MRMTSFSNRPDAFSSDMGQGMPPPPPPGGPPPIKKSNTTKYILIGCGVVTLIIILAAVGIFFAGRHMVNKIKQESGIENISVDKDKGVVVTGKDKEGNDVSFNAGNGVAMPADVPQYPGTGTPKGMNMTANGKQVVVATMETSDDPAKVVEWYKEQLKDKGWGNPNESTVNADKTKTCSLKVDKAGMNCQVVATSDGNKTTIVVNHMPK